MFRQSLRHSVSPVFRSGSAQTQPALRAYNHTHCFWRPPHPPWPRCIRRVPIQATTALLQLSQQCQSRHHCSHPSSRSFHSTQRVEGSPLLGFLIVAFKVGPQLSCVGVDTQVIVMGPSSRLPCLRSFGPLAVLHSHLSLFL